MNNAVIYARFSSVGQNEQSIDGQIRICQEFAKSKGFNIIKTYIDKAKSGTTDNRPDFQKMISESASGTFQHIIVYKFDRFARNRLDSMMYKQQLKKDFGIKVLSALEPISDDEGGEIYEMFLEWNDEKYSQRLSGRIRHGVENAIKNGTYTGARLICGYKLVDTDKIGRKGTIHKVAIDDEQAEIVRFIFSEYANGTTKQDIAIALNAKGLKYNGRSFKPKMFDGWLNNPKYTGEFLLGGKLCDNMFPQIIDKILFAKVQKRLEQNKILAGANSAIEPYYLTGKVFCGHCETAVVSDGGTSKTGKTHNYYACKKKKKSLCDKKREGKDGLELYVVQCVKDFLSDPANAALAASDVINHYEKRTSNDGLKGIEIKIAKAKNDAEGLTTAFIEAKSSLLRANIETQMADLEILLDDLQIQKSQIELERGLKITKQHILLFIAELLQGDENDKEYQRKIIDNLVYKVFISDDNNVVYFNLKGGHGLENPIITIEETDKAINNPVGVQTLSTMVEVAGLEPTTSRSLSVRATKLRYTSLFSC